MQRLRIDIASDGSTATATVVAGPTLSRDDIAAALREAGVVHGIDAAALASLQAAVADAAHTGKCTIASGTAAIDGTDGRIELDHPPGPIAGRVDDTGCIDFRERDLLLPIRTDEPLARVVPPTAGKDGRDVRGRALPGKPGKPARVQIGPGVRTEGDRLLARCAGVRSWTPPRLDVVAASVHAGDVDYRSGNLRTEGSLQVRGDVQHGFAVAAEHDLHVQGSAFDAQLTAGGNVRVDGAAAGPRCRIEAAGDIACHHATGPTLVAGGTIRFGEAATHCTARAHTILAPAGRGVVLGGELRARESIRVRTAGNQNGARTTLVVGDTTSAAAAFVRQHHGDLRLSQRALQQGRSDGPRAGKALRTAVRLADPITRDVLALREQARAALRAATIEITELLHIGVHVVFGERRLPIDVPRRAVRLRWNEADATIVEERLP